VAVNARFRKPPTGSGDDSISGIREAPAACVIPLCITAVAGFVIFLFPGLVFELAKLLIVNG